jgi:hypothetical protein
MNKIKKTDSKPRVHEGHDCDYEVHDCPDSGGKYQELKGLGSFIDCVPGSRTQRLHDRNYLKTELAKKPGDDGMGGIAIGPDTSGPPYENISVPKRIL